MRVMRWVGLVLLSAGACVVLHAQEPQPACYRYHVTDYCCDSSVPQSRTDNIPQTHVAWGSDEYLTGYIQALVDTHYFEFLVKVIVKDGIAYVFHLPCNQMVAQSILCFIYDVPCIEGVEAIDMSPEEFFCEACCCPEALSPEFVDLCCAPTPCYQVTGIWFPQTTLLFNPLIADPRQVTNSAALRFNDNAIGQHVGAVSFGDQFIFYRWRDVWCWHGDLEFGVEAGIFAVFDLDHPEACLVNTDFYVAAMFDYAVACWSWRLRLWHQSCHLGDEFLLSNPDIDRYNVSDEGIDLFVSYQMSPSVRLYAGIGDIVARDKEFPEEPFYFQWGTEIRVFGCRDCFDKLYIQPFLAMNFRSWEEHSYDIDQTYALGVEYGKLQGVGKKLRIFVEYHQGFSREGQFVNVPADFVAIRLTYGF